MQQSHPPVEVIIEVPRGGFVKRRPDGEVDFVSLLPCPFNYGSVVGTLAADGDPQDAVVLGERLGIGLQVAVTPWLRVVFVDDGQVDDKWICGEHPPSPQERRRIERFFSRYARAKWLLNLARGRSGETRSGGLCELESR
jgi:inorganic pyrophosphatase